jgi:hypothetical protein
MPLDTFTISALFGAGVLLLGLGGAIGWIAGAKSRESLRAHERHSGIISTALREANRRADDLAAKLAPFEQARMNTQRDSKGHFVNAKASVGRA